MWVGVVNWVLRRIVLVLKFGVRGGVLCNRDLAVDIFLRDALDCGLDVNVGHPGGLALLPYVGRTVVAVGRLGGLRGADSPSANYRLRRGRRGFDLRR